VVILIRRAVWKVSGASSSVAELFYAERDQSEPGCGCCITDCRSLAPVAKESSAVSHFLAYNEAQFISAAVDRSCKPIGAAAWSRVSICAAAEGHI
jgi:hypothetical protein